MADEKKKAADAPVAPAYKMPPAEITLPVFWYPDANTSTEPYCGFVTGVGQDTLNIAILPRDGFSLNPQDGVRHVSDPKLLVADARSSGAWDYPGWVKKLLNLETPSK